MVKRIKIGDDWITLYDVLTGNNVPQYLYFNSLFDDSSGELKIRTNVDWTEYGYWGSWRCGKSFSQQLAVLLINLIYPGCRTLYVMDSYPKLEDTVIKQLRKDFDKYNLFRYYSHSKEGKQLFKFGNGSEIRCRSFDKDTDILSAEYDLIAICQYEDIKEDLALQLYGRLSGKVLPRPLILTEGNPARGAARKKYFEGINARDVTDNIKRDLCLDHLSHEKTQKLIDLNRLKVIKDKRIFYIEGQMTDNADHLPAGYMDLLLRTLPKSWIDRYVYSSWDNMSEMVYSDLSLNRHIIPMVDPTVIQTFKNIISFDYGWRNPCAKLWIAADYDGNLIIYDDWEQNKQTLDQINFVNQRHDYDMKRKVTVADYAIKGSKDRNGRSLWEDMLFVGMNLVECVKKEADAIFMANTLFKNDQLYITRNCENAIREFSSWKLKDIKLGAESNPSEEPIDKDNHTCDCLSYGLLYFKGTKSIDQKKKHEWENSLEFHAANYNERTRQEIS